jgi:small subunit ribosomal protein S1
MDIDHRGTDSSYSEEDGQPQAADTSPESELGMEDLLRESDYAFRRLHRGETIEGTVVRVDQDEVLVDVGLKSEGLIPARELAGEGEPPPNLHMGDRILVVVVQPEGQEGHAILSLRRARIERAWREIEEIYQHGGIIEAPVVEFNKGGLIVDVLGVRGFVPVSQVLDLRNVSRQEGENEEVAQTLTAMVGRTLPLKVIEINRHRNRLILSERAAVQERRTQRKDELMENLQPGQIRHGVVSNITTFGAFVDLGGADGLVHVSELSYNRVNHPGEVLRVGQDVDVMVLSVDRDTKKIALSLKRAMPDPWDTVEQDYHIGQVVQATITKLAKFGAFAKVQEGLEGLIHLSELTDRPVTDPAQVVQEGQVLPAKIIHINSQRRRLGLSARQAQEPQYFGGTYGEFDTTSPFAPDLASYAETNFGDQQPQTPGAEYEESTDSQDSPDVESEPQFQDESPASSGAVTSEGASPASEEDPSQTEDPAPEVASATSQTADQL